MRQDLAPEYPHLDTAGSVSGTSSGDAIVDVGAQRMQRHAAFAVPLHPRDLGPAQPATNRDPNSERAEAHRRLHRAFHGTTEGNPSFQLLGDIFRHQLRLDLRLADFDDVQLDLALGHGGKLLANPLDVGALLADHHAWPGRMDDDPRLLGRAFNRDPADPGSL